MSGRTMIGVLGAWVIASGGCGGTSAIVDGPGPTRMAIRTSSGMFQGAFAGELNAYLGATPRYTLSVTASGGGRSWTASFGLSEAQTGAGRAVVAISNSPLAPDESGRVQLDGTQASSGFAQVLFQAGHISGSVQVMPEDLDASFDGELDFTCWVPASHLPPGALHGGTTSADASDALMPDVDFSTSECRALRDVMAAAAPPAAPSGGGGPMPFIQIQSGTMFDGMTNVGQAPLQVTFSAAGRMLDEPTLAHLAERLTLRTWPEDEVVPAAVDTLLAADGRSATATLTPAALLPDRWLALQFGAPEASLATTQTFDGQWGLRFRPGSHPAVASVLFCAAPNTGAKLIVSFSEAVTMRQPEAAVSAEQGGAVVSCPATGVEADALHDFCLTLQEAPVTVRLEAGQVSGASGAALAPRTWTMDISQLPFLETGCRGYRPVF